MGKRKLTYAISALLLVATCVTSLKAFADDTGLIVSAGAEKKFNKKASLSVEAEFRTRNDFRTADRLALSLSGQYKLTSWLKADMGYQLLTRTLPLHLSAVAHHHTLRLRQQLVGRHRC